MHEAEYITADIEEDLKSLSLLKSGDREKIRSVISSHVTQQELEESVPEPILRLLFLFVVQEVGTSDSIEKVSAETVAAVAKEIDLLVPDFRDTLLYASFRHSLINDDDKARNMASVKALCPLYGIKALKTLREDYSPLLRILAFGPDNSVVLDSTNSWPTTIKLAHAFLGNVNEHAHLLDSLEPVWQSSDMIAEMQNNISQLREALDSLDTLLERKAPKG